MLILYVKRTDKDINPITFGWLVKTRKLERIASALSGLLFSIFV